MSIELGYWKLRGLAGFIKMLLEYSGADYKEILYDHYLKEDGSWDRTEWTSVKESADFQQKFAFPNLPYMTDGNVHLTQSTAILKVNANYNRVGLARVISFEYSSNILCMRTHSSGCTKIFELIYDGFTVDHPREKYASVHSLRNIFTSTWRVSSKSAVI